MVGRTLTEIRRELGELAATDGRFVVRCGRTGERPVPVDGLRFPDRETAAEAARVAHAYRSALRRYDPRAPYYDFVVCELDAPGAPTTDPEPRARTFPRVAEDEQARRPLVAYCHDLAGAVFEALSNGDHDAVERAAMDAYLSAAETTPRDRLCLSLLATTATTLQAQLPVAAQADVLRRATRHLPAADAVENPVEAAFDRLRAVSLVDSYEIGEPTPLGFPGTVRVSGYELPVEDGQLPTLPVTLELLRRSHRGTPMATHADRIDDDTWAVSLSSANGAAGLSCVPVDTQC